MPPINIDPGGVIENTLLSVGGHALALVGGGLLAMAVVAVVFQVILKRVFGVKLVGPKRKKVSSNRWHFERLPVQRLSGAAPGRQTFGPGLSVQGFGSLFDVSAGPGDDPVAVDEVFDGPEDGFDSSEYIFCSDFDLGRSSGVVLDDEHDFPIYLQSSYFQRGDTFDWSFLKPFSLSSSDVLRSLEYQYKVVTGHDIVLAPVGYGRDSSFTAFHAARIIENIRARGFADDPMSGLNDDYLVSDYEV
ncbi:MAG: hypothetical protein M1488_02245 [Gammaproteobacteria bacterium]|nr:hypothetical protein [Gammaproteobacteria bacterium]